MAIENALEQDLTLDQQGIILWMHLADQIKKVPSRERVVLLCAFCETTQKALQGEMKKELGDKNG